MIKNVVIAFAFAALASVAASAQAKLEIVGGETYDWGKVKPPTEGYLEAEIKMKNVGNKPLKITEVRPGCGCTKTDPDKFELAPGEVSTMKVKLNIAPSQAGAIQKNITVSWADLAGNKALADFRANGTPIPANADTNVTAGYIWLKADVQRAIMMSPAPYFSFNDLRLGKEGTAKIELTNNSDSDIILSDWTTEGGIVCNFATRTTVKPGQKIEIIARVVPSTKGNFSGGVKVKTSHPETPELDIKAYGFVQETQSPVFPSGTTTK